MAYTFLKAKGHEVGRSLLDAENVGFAGEMLARAKSKGVKLLLPVDTVVADDFKAPTVSKVVPSDKIPADMEGVDIGPETIKLFTEAVRGAKTVVWNGPMGVFEVPQFAAGTKAVAQAMADAKAVTIVEIGRASWWERV